MPTLKFAVQADFDKVVRLKNEISRLENELKKLGKNASPEMVGRLEGRIASCRQEMLGLIDSSAKAGKAIDTESNKMADSMKKVGAAVASIFAFQKAQELIMHIAQVRGEFQKLDIAFTTMLGDKQKANDLMQQLVKTAATTPFSLADVTGGAKQLLAFGIEAQKVNDTLIRLGDIAAGTGAQVGQLTNVYGQIKAAGKMNGGDLLQFINAGVPIIKALADTMGVAEKQIKDFISEGKIGFKEVDAAIRSLTDSGSTFGGMMEAQSKTITGQWSSIKDNIEQIFNEIGQETEGMFNGALKITATLVENWKKVGEAIGVAVTAYGSYKAAVMVTAAYQKAYNAVLAQAAIEQNLAAIAGHKLTQAQAMAAAKTKLLTLAQQKLTVALRAAASATLLNPYVWAAAAITTLVYATYKLATATDYATEVKKEMNDTMREAEASAGVEIMKLSQLRGQLEATTKGSEEYKKIKDQIIEQYGKYNSNLATEIENVNTAADAYKNLETSIRNAALARGFEEASKKQGDKMQKELDDVLERTQRNLLARKGDKDGARIYQKIFQGITSGTMQLKSNKFGLSITGLDKETTEYLNKYTDSYNVLKAFLNKRNIQEREMKTIQDRYNPQSPEQTPTEATVVGELRNKAWYEDKKKEAQAKYDGMGRKQKLSKEGKALKAQIEEYDKAIAEWNVSATNRAGAKAQTEAEKIAGEIAEREKAIKEYYKSITEAVVSGELELRKKKLDAEDDSRDKDLKTIQLNYDIAEAEVKKREREMLKALADTRTKEWLNANPKATREQQYAYTDKLLNGDAEGNGKLTKEDLSKEQQDLLKNTLDFAKAVKAKAKIDLFQADMDAMRNYLAEYGTYEEKRLAITQQYDEKIAKAKTTGDKKMLEKQKEDDLQSLDIEQLKKSINWEEVFGSLDKVSTRGLKNIKKQLQDFIKTQKDLKPDAMKDLVKAIEDIDNATNERSPFEAFGKDFSNLIEVTKEVKTAQDAYNKALKEGTAEEIKNAKNALTNAKDKKQKALAETTASMRKSVNKAQEYVEAGQTALDMVEAFGAEPPKWMKNMLSGMSETLSGLESIDLTKPMSIVTGAMKTITGIAHTIGGVFGDKGNAEEVEKANNALISSNKLLTESINRLTEEMGKQSPKEATETYEKALREMNAKQQNDLSIMLNNARKQTTGGHSVRSEFNDKWDKSSLRDELKNYLGRDIIGLQEFLALPIDELTKLYNDDKGRDILQRILAMIAESENSHNYNGLGNDLLEYIQNYSEETFKNLQEKLRESITKVSFDSFKDEFKSALTDMTKTSGDFANDFTQMLRKSVASALIEKEYSDRIEQLHAKWQKALADDDWIDEDELADLREEQQNLTNEIIARRKEINEILGTSSTSQNASSKGYETMSEETGQAIIGRATGIQEQGEVRNTLIENINTKLDTLTAVNTDLRDVATDTRDIIANSYLELQGIRENTEAVIKPILRTAELLQEFKNNGMKMK